MNMSEDASNQTLPISDLEKLDFDVIENIPWAQILWGQVQEHTKQGFLHWCKIVQNLLGAENEECKNWCDIYSKNLEDTLCDMIVEMLQKQNSIIEKIQGLFKELRKVCLDLQLPVPEKIGEQKLSLFQEEKQLRKRLKEYENIINVRKQDLKNLHEKEHILCTQLGEKPNSAWQYSTLPSELQLNEFHKYIDELEAEKFRREEEYFRLKCDINTNINQMKYQPNSDFERQVLSSDEFLVTNEYMKQLRLFANHLIEVKKSTEEDISELRTRIEDLWKLLDTDLKDRDDFRSHYTGNSFDTLDALRTEVKRCEDIKKANIKVFAKKLRTELEFWWQKCHCSDAEKKAFTNFDISCYTEDLTDIHDLEIQKWKKYYEENKNLIELLEKHEEMWQKAIELDKSATDVNRYKNRKGNLLKEEKERIKLSKTIPKIEKEILAMSEQYRNKNGNLSFLSFGRTPEECIEYMHSQRENNRQLQLSARKKQREDALGRTPVKTPRNLFPSTSSALTPTFRTPSKRKILMTPNTDNKKRVRANTPSTPIVKPKTPQDGIPKIKITYATKVLPSQKRRSRSSLEKSKRKTSKSHETSHPDEIIEENDVNKNISYVDFQDELSAKGQCSSSFVNSNGHNKRNA